MPYRGTFDGKADSIRLLGTLADSGVWIGYDQKHKDLAYAIIQTIVFYSYWYSSSLEDALSGHDMIVIGASAGGVEALMTLVYALPAHFPASVFVVLHIPALKPSTLPALLCHAGPLRAFHPLDHELIEQQLIYVAPPDCHLLVEVGQVRLSKGLKEKWSRPAIDPLFRSAAHAYGPRVIGVILTGALDDGTAGLLAVKRCGGVAIVQDPDSARYPAMPRSALSSVAVDYTVPLSGIAPLLVRLVAGGD